MSTLDGLARLTRLIKAADEVLEAGEPLQPSEPTLQRAAGDGSQVAKAAEVLDNHTREEFLRAFTAPASPRNGN